MKRETLNVNELIELAKQGNTDAFEKILREYEKRISALVDKVVEEAGYRYRFNDGKKELLQIARHQLSECMYGYKENRSEFFTYASKCIEYSLRNEFRKDRTQKGMINQFAYRLDNRINDDEDMYYIDLVTNNQPSFEGIYCMDERNPQVVAEMIREDVGELNAEIYNLKIQGYKNSEISEMLNISVKKVSEGYNNIRKFYNGTLTKKK